jgi:hypothetical protein
MYGVIYNIGMKKIIFTEKMIWDEIIENLDKNIMALRSELHWSE